MTQLTEQEQIDIFMRSLPEQEYISVTKEQLIQVLQSANVDEFGIQFIAYELGFK